MVLRREALITVMGMQGMLHSVEAYASQDFSSTSCAYDGEAIELFLIKRDSARSSRPPFDRVLVPTRVQ
jgi:alcohol dehydrogenase class IV